MKSKVDHQFDISASALLDQYCSKQYYIDRFEQDGVHDFEFVKFDEDGDKVSIEILRKEVIHYDRVPKFMEKIGINLVGDAVNVRIFIDWDKKTGVGTNKVKVKAAPVNVSILSKVKDKGEDSCLNVVEVEFKAKIPVVGKQVEKFVMPKIERGAKKDLQKSAEYFSSIGL